MNKLLKYGTVGMLCLLSCQCMSAQQMEPKFTSEPIQTPQTQNFIRYGDTPVNLYTGTIGTSIPVYTYKDNDFEIPISLNYASNGLIANNQTGIVGLGWYLNAGGVISRTIEGIPDEDSSGGGKAAGYYKYHREAVVDEQSNPLTRGKMMNIDTYQPIEAYTYLAEPGDSNSAQYESTPDVFHFSFMGYQGMFQFDVNKKIRVYNTNSSQHNFKVTAVNFINPLISSFEITTNDGYKYIFGGEKDGDYNKEYIMDWENYKKVLSWQLTKIIAPNGRTVSFVYRTGDFMSRSYVKNRRPGTDYLWYSTTYTKYYLRDPLSETSVFPTYLSKIVIDNTSQISFDYSPKEPERYGPDRDTSEYPALLKLSSICVTSLFPNIEQICNCDLHYQYPSSGNKTLLLSKADFGDGKTYTMDYFGLREGRFPFGSTYTIDHWGYYNGDGSIHLDNFLSLPNEDEQGIEIIPDYNKRNPNANFSKLGMLTKITYPTGGYTTYEYEANSYSRRAVDLPLIGSYRRESKEAGGVRIKVVTDYAETGECNRREFTYKNQDGSSSGILLKMPRYSLAFDIYSKSQGYIHIHKGNPQDKSPLSLDESHIEYARVVESQSDGSITEYNYIHSFYPAYADESQIPLSINYPYPTGTIVSENANLARRIMSRPRSKAYLRGQLASMYKSLNGKLVYAEEYQYLNPSILPITGGVSPFANVLCSVRSAGDMFYLDMTDTPDRAQVARKATKEYLDGKVLTNVTEYAYKSPTYGKLNCITSTGHDGSTHRERMEYVEDKPNRTVTEQLMLSLFQTRNPIRTVLTIQKNDNDKEWVVKGEYNQFKTYGKLIRLEEVRKTNFSQLPEWKNFELDYPNTDFHNDAYDLKGNLTQQTQKDGTVSTCVWGYNHRYPVAIVKNATVQDVEAVVGSLESFASQMSPNRNVLLLNDLPNTLVTHYRYKPLVGISSQTDERGVSTFYEYDSQGRLQCVKDQDENVVSRNFYHYKSINQ